MSLLDALRDIMRDSTPIALRCKPNDLCVVIQEGKNQGRWCTVLYADTRPGWWVVRAMQPMHCYTTGLQWEAGNFGRCQDSALQPIRGKPAEQGMTRWVPTARPVEDIGVIRIKQSIWPA